MALTSGAKLGPYEILKPLGAGGMGEVYRANDTRLDRTVAIKILREHLAESPEAKQRFEREARSISSLNHPNICALYDVGSHDGTSYLVMEFVQGETLLTRRPHSCLVNVSRLSEEQFPPVHRPRQAQSRSYCLVYIHSFRVPLRPIGEFLEVCKKVVPRSLVGSRRASAIGASHLAGTMNFAYGQSDC